MTPEQQELIDLIRNEVAELVLAEDEPQDDTALLDKHLERAECIANAAEVMGLKGLSQCCRQIVNNLTQWHDKLDSFHNPQRQLLESWPIHFLGYLQYLHEPQQLEAAVDDLVIFMGEPDWVDTRLGEAAIELRGNLLQLQLEEVASNPTDSPRPTEVDIGMVSVALDDDVRPELLEGLLIELPEQCETFTQSLLDYQSRGELSLLLVGQRIAHTIKGAANVVGVKGIANLMHYTEEILQQIERADCQPESVLADFLLETADCLSAMTDLLLNGEVFSRSHELPAPPEALSVMRRLVACAQHIDKVGVQVDDSVLVDTLYPDGAASVGPTEQAGKATEQVLSPSSETVDVAGQLQSDVRIGRSQFNELQRFAGENIIAETQLQTRLYQLAEYLQQVLNYQNQLRHMADDLQLLVDVKNVFGRKSLKLGAVQELPDSVSFALTESGLDQLELEHYNEMHSFAHQLLELATDAREQTLQAQDGLLQIQDLGAEQHQRNRHNHELLLRARMLPFSTLESRLQRCVRQASRQAEKDIHFSIEGEETLVDSVVLQQLADPLMHLLRNSVDHGIESPESRQAAGKSSQGNIQLQVKELGGSLTINCQDDGGGIDRQAIVAQAISQGLLAEDVDEQTLSDDVIEQFILRSGFSTRDQASQLSGRGIGLDAVVSQLQMCRGSLSVTSTPGQGCCFSASLPQCMQSGYGLLISAAGRSLALLTRGVKQIIYLEPKDVDQIDFQGGYFDGQDLIAVESLDTHLQFAQQQINTSRARVLLLVERVGDPLYGLLVDDISACRELVIKPLNQFTPNLPGIVGATVLGDGCVAPVIDSAELLNHGVSQLEVDDQLKISTAEELPNPGGRPMALVVDDSLSVRRSLSEFVTDLGMDVRTAKDGFEAIHVIEEQVPTLMLVDLEMPRMNGLELTAHVRAHQQARQVPVIMITSRNTEKHRRMANEVGVNQFLPKPYSEDELAQTIQTQMAS
ncbi:hypothetical protein R50073_28920 [Maricurvus nonylphenolicus]|uniref:hybrid sensor histidine kinase/response regulator n=1 Tax=Maricurvus nonylphenolicus TaxID=1008307 RepID=UPI0036F3B1F3